jgi:hypothetical protein
MLEKNNDLSNKYWVRVADFITKMSINPITKVDDYQNKCHLNKKRLISLNAQLNPILYNT